MGNSQYGEIGGVTRGVAWKDRLVPWTHRAGHDGWKLVEKPLEPIQALTAAGLDFEVEAVNLSTLLNEPMADEHTVIRGTNGEGVFGTFSDNVGVIQYRALAEFADEIQRVYPDAHVISAFGLHRNKQAVMCLSIPTEARELFGAHVNPYVNIASSHNGTLKFIVRDSWLITECMNTFAASFRGTSNVIAVKHTATAEERLALAKRAVTELLQGNKDMAEFMAKHINSRITAKQVDEFIVKVIGPMPKDEGRERTNWQERFAGIKAEYKAPWNRYAQRTVWGALMAINGYEQWHMPVRKAKDSGTHVRQERIVESLLRGSAPLTDKALALVKG